ncbi:hypothetical protein B566_EDAN017243 [Ephemera danica]|nr:hypothetical protein B566_EDAN017243 [Ephemera danica]
MMIRRNETTLLPIQQSGIMKREENHILSNLLVTADRNMCKNSTKVGDKNSSNQNAVNFVIVFLFSAVLFFSR